MLRFVAADGRPPNRGPGRPIRTWQRDGRSFAEAVVHDEGLRLRWDDVGTLLVTPDSPLVRLWPAPGVSADTALARAATIVQPILLQARGYQALHASAVATPAGAAAFCGLSGTGKSTLAYALGRQPGSRQIADDALVLDTRAGSVLACPIPFRSRLRAPSQAFFERQDGHEGTTVEPDAPAAPLAAVFLLDAPDAATGRVNLVRLPQTQAFTALLTHAHCFDENDRAHVAALTQAYLDVAAHVPVYRLSYARTFAGIDALLEKVGDVLAGHSPVTAGA